MNNCIFTTHHTLTKDHALHSLTSLLKLQTETTVWDNFIIYNTHEDEISNEWLSSLIFDLDVFNQIQNLFVFPYENGKYPKTLNQDLINQFQLLVSSGLIAPGKTLLLKSDYCVSFNFNKVFNEQSNINNIWSLPIYNAKEKICNEVSMQLIYERLQLPTFVPVDGVTYYRGGTNSPHTPGTMETPYEELSPFADINETDPHILFVSHNIQNDYNLHVLTNDVIKTSLQLSKKSFDINSTWGGSHGWFNGAWGLAGIDRNEEIRAFGVHMYHGIISPNRDKDRTDPRKVIDGERY